MNSGLKLGMILLVLLSVLGLCQGHGRLRCPPGRSTLWRDGYAAPENYQDNELNCGGRWKHWDLHGGKCGACGDPYDVDIQDNQPPNGKYAKPGILTQCFNSSATDYITTFTQITANHKGYVEYRLCPQNDFNTPVTQECLDKNLLQIRDKGGRNHGTRYKLRTDDKDLTLQVKIPPGMTCHQCVLQWRYIAANSWGCDQITKYRRKCGIGYGGQESFFNCADIAILPDCTQVKVAKHWSSSVCNQFGIRSTNNKPKESNGKPTESKKEEKSDTSSTKPEEKKNNNNDDNNKGKEKPKDNSSKDSTPPEKNTSPHKSKSESNTEVKPKTPEKKESSNSSKTKPTPPAKKPSSTTTKPKKTVEKKTLTPTPRPTPSKTKSPPKPSPPTNSKKTKICHAVGIWSNIRSMYYWCRINCRGGNCPPFMCVCK